MVRKSVEETLNELLNKEVEELTSAAKYERTENGRITVLVITAEN